MPDSGIYAITNINTGKVYIGRAINLEKRKLRHFVMLENGTHHSIKLQRSYVKYGRDSFTAKTLLICLPEHLGLFEQRAIDAYDACIDGYNVCPISGSVMSGRTHTEEHKQRLSVKMKGRTKSPETCAKLSAVSIGKKHSPERVAAMIERLRSPEMRAAISARMIGNQNCKGMRYSESVIANYRAAWTPERRAAQSIRLSGKKCPSKNP